MTPDTATAPADTATDAAEAPVRETLPTSLKKLGKSSDKYAVDPSQVHPAAAARSRRFDLDPDRVRQRAESFIKEGGQLTPCSVRRTKSGYEIVMGDHRRAAAELINTDKTLKSAAKKAGLLDEKTGLFLLNIIVFTGDDQAAFLASFAENVESVEVTDIDRAYNIKRMHEEFKMSFEDIATRIPGKAGKPIKAQWARRLMKLTDLDEATQKLVHDGKIAGHIAAMQLVTVSDEDRPALVRDLVAQHRETEGSIPATAVRDAVRNHRQDGDGQPESAAVSKTMKEVRDDITAVREQLAEAEGTDDEDPVAKAFFDKMFDYLRGRVGIKGVSNALEAVYEAGAESAKK